MGFLIDKDFGIFEPILKKRPEINIEKFKLDLANYYLPYVERLIALKRPAIVGISAIQGAGKTTQGEILEILLKNQGLNSVSLSIDDHYVTHKELTELQKKDPRFIRRGVTHDITLAIRNLQALQEMQVNQAVLVSEYDKGAYQGDGERFRWINLETDLTLKAVVLNKMLHLTAAKFKEKILTLPENMGGDVPLGEPFLSKSLIEFLESVGNSAVTVFEDAQGMVHFAVQSEILAAKEDLPKGWRLVSEKPDFIFYDGWFVGARSVSDEKVFDQSLPALETPEDKQFAKDVNKKLLEYDKLWEMINFLTVLYVPHYEMALEWRENAEKPLRVKGEGMSAEQIKEFVYYFWRSVHPAIHIKNLAHDEKHTNLVAIIGDDHTVLEMRSPTEVLSRYP